MDIQQLDHKRGFTIVELLIVIVVIAILAAVSVVAYSGIQARASDSRMRAGVNQFEKALRQYAVDNPLSTLGGLSSTVALSASGCSDGISGWVASGRYICTPEDALVNAKLLPGGFMLSLPANSYYATANTTGVHSIMLYKCGTVAAEPGKYALYWTLRSPSDEDTASINSILAVCGNNQIRDTWGMRSGKLLQL